MFFQFNDHWDFLICELSIDRLWHVFNWVTFFFFFADTFCILCTLTMCYKYFSQFVYHYVTQFPIYFNPPCKQLDACIICQSVNVKVSINCSLWCVCVWVAQPCLTLCNPTNCTPPGSSAHGKNTGVGSLSLCQEISPTQGSNPGLLHWQEDSLLPGPQRSTLFPLHCWNTVLSHSLSLSLSLSLSWIM